ncbi:transcriptional regulator [Sphingobium sp.]|uniref:transcriptional regulator n=1 Tax=Sphingobium sp. TaxID=1912891 RepID=UPI002D1347D5|nr:transcriptional regulator [Sphingobium sp.]HUD90042.1 transcriptional regulator [Sphingobium sp.]
MPLRAIHSARDPAVLETIKLMSGRRIEMTRRAEKITQESFAAQVGIGARWLREIEAGNPKSRLDDHFRCAHALGLSTGHLVIPLLFMEHQRVFPRGLLEGDLSKIETVCIDAIARHNLDMLSFQLLPRDADRRPDSREDD